MKTSKLALFSNLPSTFTYLSLSSQNNYTMTNTIFFSLCLLFMISNSSCNSKTDSVEKGNKQLERVEKNATKKLYKTIDSMVKMLEKDNCDYAKFMDEYLDPMQVMRFKEEGRFKEIAELFGSSETKTALLKFLKIAKNIEPTYLNDYRTKAGFEHPTMTQPLVFENIDGVWFLKN